MIIFFGSSEYSIPVARSLIKAGFNLTVITTPDKPVGRRQILTPNPLARFAKDNRLPAFKLKNLEKSQLSRELIVKIKQADLGVCCVYGKIIPPWLIDNFERGILNIHPSLLPKYRGASPAAGMILNEEKSSGVTIIKMDEKVDHGPIIVQVKDEIKPDKTAQSLYRRLFGLAAKITPPTTKAYLNKTLAPTIQDHSQASFTPRLTRDDGYVKKELLQKALQGKTVSFSSLPPIFPKTITNPKKKYFAAQAVFNLYRALYPWPGLWTKINRQGTAKRLKITDAKLEKGKFKPLQVQLEGKQPVNFEEFSKNRSLL